MTLDPSVFSNFISDDSDEPLADIFSEMCCQILIKSIWFQTIKINIEKLHKLYAKHENSAGKNDSSFFENQ